MQKFDIVCVYDNVAEVFSDRLVLEINEQSAKRAFIQACNENRIVRHHDFALFKLGVYDRFTGCITPVVPKVIVTGVDVIRDAKKCEKYEQVKEVNKNA